MPDSIQQLQNPTEIFDSMAKNQFNVMPSLKPTIHTLLDKKVNLENYDWVSLVAWTIKRT